MRRRRKRDLCPVRLSSAHRAVWRALAACSMLGVAGVACAADRRPTSATDGEQVSFNGAFLRGAAANVDLSVFAKEAALPPGTHELDIYVNGNFLQRAKVLFVQQDSAVVACLARQTFLDAGVLEDALAKTEGDDCMPASRAVEGGRTTVDVPRMRLDVQIPQALMHRTVLGYVPMSAWDEGAPVGFLRYSGSYYSRSAGNTGTNNESGFVSIDAGANLGLWQLRNQSSYRYSSGGGSQFNLGGTYVRRALPSWQSEATAGEISTQGGIFDSFDFRGVRLSSDDRMLSPNRQGYAPVIRGTANTNARVVVRQGVYVVYETTVPPGPFVIDDLYPTQNSGDLQVEVTESDGQVRSFVVPYAAVANSLRPGLSRYAVHAGRTNVPYIGAKDATFGQATYEHGLSNEITLNGGAQAASNGYWSVAAGGVYASSFGALGANLAYSSSKVDGARTGGWQMRASYNNTFAPTGTTLTLAGYRYSTSGYRTLADSLNGGSTPYYHLDDTGGYLRSNTFRQKNRFDLTLSQSLGQYGSINVSGVRMQYYDGLRPSDQYAVSYNNSLGKVAYSLSLARERVSSPEGGRSQTAVMLSLNIPLEIGNRGSTLGASISRRSSEGTQMQSSLTGTAGASAEYSYNFNASRDTGANTTGVGANLTRATSVGTFGAGAARSDGSTILSGTARGAVVAHEGGMLFGPYIGETFGIVHAPGAEGAQLRNAPGVTLNEDGYALVPSLMPYRYNTISLDPADMSGDAELEDTQRRVAPYAGAVPYIRFETRTGHAVLVSVRDQQGGALPLGATVKDADGREIGVVGQGSRLYARVPAREGVMHVSRGNQPDCEIPYSLPSERLDEPVIRFQAACAAPGTRLRADTAVPNVASR
ncbi:fimbria/pilus outer membrane usher protein [Uliginosibacterium sp. sgz301328]|uniref:fimbria/pilus outer membrane usher protein n=1 Tax=Uliginosibacterium sp. sgz301328 TaxID=3243764 RepID=UPI00359E1A69